MTPFTTPLSGRGRRSGGGGVILLSGFRIWSVGACLDLTGYAGPEKELVWKLARQLVLQLGGNGQVSCQLGSG